MTNDNRDDPNAGKEKDQAGPDTFDRDDFSPPPPTRSERRDPFFTDFEDDETAEIDDIEATDFGHDYEDDDSDYPADDDPEGLWDPDPAPTAGDGAQTPARSGEMRFDSWPREHPEEEPPPPEEPDLWSTPLPAAGVSLNRKDDRDWDDEPDDEELPEGDEDDDPDDDNDQWDPAAEEDDLFDEDPEQDDDDDIFDKDAPEDDDSYDEDEADDEPEAWDRDYGDEVVEEELEQSPSVPWGLVAVGVLALVLLGAGGYGVMQQRADADAEIRELRAQLATSINPEEVASARDALREFEQQNEALQAELNALQLENRRLSDTVSGLEAQLEGQQQAAAELKRNAEQAQKAAAAAARSAPAATAGSGSWFVNFGSYADRELAEQWASRLRTGNSKVIVAPAASNGRSLYRVRVVGLASKTEAERVARQLEQTHDLSKLWVGQE